MSIRPGIILQLLWVPGRESLRVLCQMKPPLSLLPKPASLDALKSSIFSRFSIVLGSRPFNFVPASHYLTRKTSFRPLDSRPPPGMTMAALPPSPAAPAPAVVSKPNLLMLPLEDTIYRRRLPATGIAFSSEEGRRLFSDALMHGTLENFFPLAEQFRTQDDPAFCGLTTLTMVLNALQVDPCRKWKGVWRWYHETMLDCCVRLDVIKNEGLTFAQFICLANCNGCNVKYAQQVWLPTPQSQKQLPTIRPQLPPLSSDSSEYGRFRHSSSAASSISTDTTEHLNAASLANHIRKFRKVVERVSRKSGDMFLVVSYSRGAFGQTGDGHFSPIGGYHRESDRVLLMDVARFKYPPHWVKIPDLVQAMSQIDRVTGQPRGYCVLRKTRSSDYGRLHLFQLELPPRSHSGDFFRRFFEILRDNLKALKLETSDRRKVLQDVFSCFIKTLSRSSPMRSLLGGARLEDRSRVRLLSDFSSAEDSASGDEGTMTANSWRCFDTPPSGSLGGSGAGILGHGGVGGVGSPNSNEEEGESTPNIAARMLSQLRAKPWYPDLLGRFEEGVREGVFEEFVIKEWNFDGNSRPPQIIQKIDSTFSSENNLGHPTSTTTVDAIFITFFLAFLPRIATLLPTPKHVKALIEVIQDHRIISEQLPPPPSDQQSSCCSDTTTSADDEDDDVPTQEDGEGDNSRPPPSERNKKCVSAQIQRESDGEIDFVTSVLRLRQILDRLLLHSYTETLANVTKGGSGVGTFKIHSHRNIYEQEAK